MLSIISAHILEGWIWRRKLRVIDSVYRVDKRFHKRVFRTSCVNIIIIHNIFIWCCSLIKSHLLWFSVKRTQASTSTTSSTRDLRARRWSMPATLMKVMTWAIGVPIGAWGSSATIHTLPQTIHCIHTWCKRCLRNYLNVCTGKAQSIWSNL